jgi:peroxiredoxin/uncharacterized membrane protein YphA (DoxX/SURF4 family)
LSYGILLLRLVLGLTLVGHGSQKLFGVLGGLGPRGEAEFLAGLGFRAAPLMAFVLGAGEVAAGAMFAGGLLVPVAALVLAVFMLNAIGTALRPNGYWIVNGGYEYAILIWTVVVAVAATGGGRFSLDAAIGWSASISGLWWAIGVAATSVLLSALSLTVFRRPGLAAEQAHAPGHGRPQAAHDPLILPAGLPAPVDDGAASHLPGAVLPSVALRATDGTTVDLSQLPGWTVVFAYPRTGHPGVEPAGGIEAWDAIPGARGCTPQACGFRDRIGDFAALGVRVFGLSAQDSDYQREAAERLGLPYPLLSDPGLALADALALPTFEFAGDRLLKRLTMLVRDGRIVGVIYPVFPPDEAAAATLAWLRDRLPSSQLGSTDTSISET